MLEIIGYARDVEELANSLYSEMSTYFRNQKEIQFASICQGLSDDEKEHYQLMCQAIEYINHNDLKFPSDIVIDDKTKEDHKEIFSQYQELMNNDQLTEENALEFIIKIELFEWNSYFLYVINKMKEYDNSFYDGIQKIETHKNRVIDYLKEINFDFQRIKGLMRLPSIIEKKLLIIDDDDAIRGLLFDVFKNEFEIGLASDGKEGLEKIDTSHFDLIITDVDMPNVNGIDFYRNAVKEHPEISNRIIFMTGAVDKHKSFFMQNKITFLGKPFSILALKDLANQQLMNYQKAGLPIANN